MFDQGPEAMFIIFERFFGPFTLGDVADGDHRQKRAAVSVMDQSAAVIKDALFARGDLADLYFLITQLLAVEDAGQRPLLYREQGPVYFSQLEYFRELV